MGVKIGIVIILLGVIGLGLRGYTDSPHLTGAIFGLVIAFGAGMMLVTLALLHV